MLALIYDLHRNEHMTRDISYKATSCRLGLSSISGQGLQAGHNYHDHHTKKKDVMPKAFKIDQIHANPPSVEALRLKEKASTPINVYLAMSYKLNIKQM